MIYSTFGSCHSNAQAASCQLNLTSKINEFIDEAWTNGPPLTGTIWVYGATYVDQPLILRNGIYVDFLSHLVLLPEGRAFIDSGGSVRARVSNANVQTSPVLLGCETFAIAPELDDEVPVMRFTAEDQLDNGGNGGFKFNIIENIYVEVSDANPRYPSIIEMQAEPSFIDDEGKEYIGEASMNLFRRIRVDSADGFVKMVVLDPQSASSEPGWMNGTYFKDCTIQQYRDYLLEFVNSELVASEPTEADAEGMNHSLFYHFLGRCDPESEYGFKDIAGNHNHFDHVAVLGWFDRSVSAEGTNVYSWTWNDGGIPASAFTLPPTIIGSYNFFNYSPIYKDTDLIVLSPAEVSSTGCSS